MICGCDCKWLLMVITINDFVIDDSGGWNQDKDGGD